MSKRNSCIRWTITAGSAAAVGGMTGVVAGPGPGILAGIAWANFMNSVLPRIMMTAEQEALLTEPVSGDVPFEFRVRFGLRVADSEQERLVPWQCGASATPGQT